MKKIRTKKKENGITLIALVITIIVLLIIAGITMFYLFGENGLLNKVNDAIVENDKAEIEEKVKLLLSEYKINKNTEKDSNFFKFLVRRIQEGVAKNEGDTYSFLLEGWQVTITENEIISIEKMNLNVYKVYPSVSYLKSDMELTEGKLVQTEGYWSKELGGSAYYDIVASTVLTVDDEKCIKLDNGLYAELHAINDTITVNQFGAFGDGKHGDSEKIERALNSGYTNIIFESENYIADKHINVNKSDINILGNESNIIMQDDFKFIENHFMFISGTEDSILNNLSMYNLNIITNKIISEYNDAIQLRLKYVNNLEIANCKFYVPEIEGDTSRHTTNIWIIGSANNVYIYNNQFINLSNSSVGGNIWISDVTSDISKNINISDNYFEKSSHDETISIRIGKIDNVTIENNQFNIHEEKVENPSDMNFSIGRDGENQISNVKFVNNIINTQSRGEIFSLEAKDNILIENNIINHTFYEINTDAGRIFNNINTKVIAKNNKININSKSDKKTYFSINRNSAELYNNMITIENNVKTLLVSATDILLDNNDIFIKKAIDSLVLDTTGSYLNNNIHIEENINNIFEYSEYGDYEILNDIKISNNNFYLNNAEKLIHIYNVALNNKKIIVENNNINIDETLGDKYLIFIQNLKDANSQKITFTGNNISIFKKVGFWNNNTNHVVIVNSNEITTNTIL